MRRLLQYLLLQAVLCLYFAQPMFQESNEIEKRIYSPRKFNLNRWFDFDWSEDSVEKHSKESNESYSDESVEKLPEHRLGEVRGTRKIEKTLPKKEDLERVRRRVRRRRRYLFLLTAAIAAKAAAVATALTILLPLSLKITTFLSIKSVFVGTVAILLASVIGFLKILQEPSGTQKTVVHFDKNHRRIYNDYDPSHMHQGHFWKDTQDFEGGN